MKSWVVGTDLGSGMLRLPTGTIPDTDQKGLAVPGTSTIRVPNVAARPNRNSQTHPNMTWRKIARWLAGPLPSTFRRDEDLIAGVKTLKDNEVQPPFQG